MAEGGAFGRADAVFISIEAQKSSGCLHAHCQLFVQCMHQHTPLGDIMARLYGSGARELVDGYLEYKRHVVRQEYGEPEGVDDRLDEHEKV